MKYVECAYCGNKIPLGKHVVSHRLYCGLYCSDRCFLMAMVPDRQVSVLTPAIAENYDAKIKED